MSKQTFIVVLCVAAAAAGAGYGLARPSRQAMMAKAEPAVAAADDEDKIVYYRNPMGLPDTSPVPKNDSMGMAYIPVRAKDARDVGAVSVSPGRMQTLGVRTAPVESRAVLPRIVRATGVVKLDERRMAMVTTRADGWIEKLEVAATGEQVRRGQVLGWIYAPELAAAEQEYLVAARLQHVHGDDGALVAASAQRLASLGVPADEVARLHRTGQALRRVAVRAPEDGIISEKMAVEGARAAMGDPLFRLADLSSVWLIADIQESELGAVHPGQTVEATFIAFPGRTFFGSVDFVYPALASDTRTARVRIIIPNKDLSLRAEMFASAIIDASAAPDGKPVLTVPDSAVIDSGIRQVVLIEKGEGRFEPRPVKIGARSEGDIRILDGLEAGDRVVVSANFLIDSESNLKAALQSFVAGDAK